MSDNELLQIEEGIVKALKNVYDPEIPVNIYDLGLIYEIDVDHSTGNVVITMTFTAPHCPMAEFILEDTKMKVEAVKGVKNVEVIVTFEPTWHRDMMSEEALLELGFL